MNSFSEELRKTRESLNITLADISRKTRINIKYLEALERGTFDILPQTYIRAFIKSYSEAVGLHANEMLKKYDISVVRKFDETSTNQFHADSITDSSFQSGATSVSEKDLIEQTKTRKIIFTAVLTVFGILVLLYLFNYISFNTPTANVVETPFQDVVQEQEKNNPAPQKADTLTTVKAKAALPDSLVLRAMATDSTWITIIRDNRAPRRGYVLNGSRRVWKAKDSFKINISNAGAIKFSLNGIDLGTLGKNNQYIRSYKITMDTLAARMQ